MKNLRFLISGIFCILISYSLCSCGGDDDDESNQSAQPSTPNPSQPNSNKRLVKIDELGEETIEFKYDNQGNLVFVSVVEGDEYSEFTYEYGNNEIIVRGFEEKRLDGTGGDNVSKTYHLLDGKVISLAVEEEYNEFVDGYYEKESYVYNFVYNNTNNHLTRVSCNSHDGSEEYNFSWIDGMLKEVQSIVNTHFSYESHKTYVYNTNPLVCKGFLPLLSDPEMLEECYLLIAKPELALMTVNCLPYSLKIDGSLFETFTYEFDNEGYIRKVYSQAESGNNEDAIYIFTWE